MGGRGASSGLSDKGKKYGSEYTTLHQSGNIKFEDFDKNFEVPASLTDSIMAEGKRKKVEPLKCW